MLIDPMSFFNEIHEVDPFESHAENDTVDIGVNFDFFQTDAAEIPVTVNDKPTTPKKRGRKPNTPVVLSPGGVSTANADTPDAHMVVATTDYGAGFVETNATLRGTIMQIDQLAGEVKSDIDEVRKSKTMKSKYTYLTNLNSTVASLLSTKIQAIKEINANISQTYKLDLDRMKALKANEKDSNDEMRLMDMYTAFINTPVGTFNPIQQNAPMQDVVTNGMIAQAAVPMGQLPHGQLTPEENRMRMENNPNIQNVVRYDPDTGARCFDVIDKTTGMSIPNYPKLDDFLLEETVLDTRAGIARNRNLNQVWPLIPMNGPASTIKISEY